MRLNKKLRVNKLNIEKHFIKLSDFVVRELVIADRDACLFFLKGISDAKDISQFIIEPVLKVKELPKENALEYIKNQVIMLPEINEQEDLDKLLYEIIKGKTVMLIDGEDKAIVLPIDKFKERAIAEPPTSAVMKGPREGFNENIKTNITMVRKILSSKNLISYSIDVGVQTKTSVCVMYLDNIAQQEIVNKIINKIKLINIDAVIDSHYIASFLAERKKSMLKQVGVSEKPDIVCAKMLEGRVAILVDGSPIVLTLPFILAEDFQSGDDYYADYYRATMLRILRIISIFLTILLPGLYISLQLYHFRSMPIKFIVTILNSTQGLPFTPFSEIMLVIVLFEILYEASLRMPKYLGLALSIVGALILGDTAVKAGLISPPAVMIVAVSGITIYTIPEQSSQLSMIRIIYTIVGGLLGFYGMMLFSVFIIMYAADFNNYGAPYLSPITPRLQHDYEDALFKANLINMKKRPVSIPNKNSTRMR